MRVLSVGMSMEHGSRAKVTHRARDMLHAPHESIMVGVHRQVHTNRNPQRSELRGIHIQITVPLGAWRSPRVAHPLWTFYCLYLSCQQRRGALASVYSGGSCPPLLWSFPFSFICSYPSFGFKRICELREREFPPLDTHVDPLPTLRERDKGGTLKNFGVE